MTVGSSEAATPLLGQVVAERYFVEELLGEGGMGTVYRARHITLEKKVALKVLHGEFSRKQDLVDRFLLEAKAASSIRNEHVIDITDFGITGDGYVFFAMEYLKGCDLHGELRKSVSNGELFPWVRAQDIFLQVCDALAAAHAQGIIHRDLKPENIFLVEGTGREDYVKLLDFGIAKVTSPNGDEGERKLTKTGMLFGTPEYMAPEQARGEKPDHRVDVYAMGCLLFQFITGTVPFKAESFMAILTQHMIEPVPEISVDLLKRSGAPTGVLGIIDKALAKDRDERFSSIRDLAEAVASVGEMTTPGVAPHAPQGKRTNRETALVNGRKKRPSQHGNWTGSVRKISIIEEDEEQAYAVEAVVEPETKSNGKLIVGVVAALALAGGGFAAATMMGGGETASDGAEAGTATTAPATTAPSTNTQVQAAGGSAVVPAALPGTTVDKAVLPETAQMADAGTPRLIPDSVALEPVVKPKTKVRGGKKPRGEQGKDDGKTSTAASDTEPKDSGKTETKDATKTETKTGSKTPDSMGEPKIKDPFGGG